LRYRLKAGDKVYIFNKGYHRNVTVEGFYCYGMKATNCLVPFYARSFYSCAYDHGNRFIVVNVKWHYYAAAVIEFIRQRYAKILGHK
jgi:predicted ATPase